jgi:hypothetical protein
LYRGLKASCRFGRPLRRFSRRSRSVLRQACLSGAFGVIGLVLLLTVGVMHKRPLRRLVERLVREVDAQAMSH